MNKLVKRLLTGTLAFATILTALPVTAVHASGNQYWTESAERVGYLAGVPFRITSKATGEFHIVVTDNNGQFSTASSWASHKVNTNAAKAIKIVDKITLDGLETGRKYKLSGWQMLKEENAEFLIDGKRVDSDYTFTADSEKNGS